MSPAHKATQPASSVPPAGDAASTPLFEIGEPARRALLLAGATVFGEKGLDGASTREIAALARQNLASIAYYFGSKEGLYLAIARAIGEELAGRLTPLVGLMDTRGPRMEAVQALALLKRLMATMVQVMMTSELPAVSQFIVREQQKPGPAFELIYEGGMRRVNETVTHLVAVIFDLPTESLAAKLHAHALIGQVLGFRVAHAALLHRTGWSAVGPREAQQITEIVLNNLDLMAAGHAHRSVPAPVPRTPRLRKARRPESSS